MIPTTTDVLIVGAGPTGLALAVALQQADIDHVIIDKLDAGQTTSRAAVIHAHTLEMLEQLGVSDTMCEQGLKLHDFTIRDRGRALVSMHFDNLPSKYSFLLMLPQEATEKILSDQLLARGGSIYRSVTATSIKQENYGAKVAIATAHGESEIKARYVIGADGMHSIVRKSSGIDFEGDSYAESFVLADVQMDWSFNNREVSLFFSPEGLVVVAPLPDGSFRIVATMEDAPEQPKVDDIQELLNTRGPVGTSGNISQVNWSSRFRVHHRVANSYRQDHLLLMGDAAHVHSPAGGQGMNTGIVDSIVLARVLEAVIKKNQPELILETYQRLRRPAAVDVLGLAGRLTSMATMRGAIKRQVRNAILVAINYLPPVKRRLLMNLSGLSRKELSTL